MSVRGQCDILICLDDVVGKRHPYRQLDRQLDFAVLSKPLQALYSDKGRTELGAKRAFRMLVLQVIEDISDREMERFMGENVAAKWFCQFGLAEKSPDHGFFGDFRKRLGTKRLMDIFNVLRCSLKAQGLVREVFTFVDASHENASAIIHHMSGSVFVA